MKSTWEAIADLHKGELCNEGICVSVSDIWSLDVWLPGAKHRQQSFKTERPYFTNKHFITNQTLLSWSINYRGRSQVGHRKERTGEDSICNIQPPCLNESCVRDGYVRVLISCLTRAGAAGNRWWNQPVAMETTVSHRIPRTMECHNLRLIFPDTRQTWPHTTSAISEDHHQCTLPRVNVSCCETPCVNNLHRTLTKFQTSELLVLK